MSHMRHHALHVSMQRSIDLAQDHIRAGNEVAAKLETEIVSELGLALSEDCANKTQALMDIRDLVDGIGQAARSKLTASQKLEHIQDVLASLATPL